MSELCPVFRPKPGCPLGGPKQKGSQGDNPADTEAEEGGRAGQEGGLGKEEEAGSPMVSGGEAEA